LTHVAILEGLGDFLGIAGIMGTAGKVGRQVVLEATGVVSPGATTDDCGIEEGVVEFVDSVASDAG
jgi:hypothetical protein